MINKVTTLTKNQSLDDLTIQEHLDEQNALGYYLIGIDNLNGWYRFFWAKTE